MQRIEILAPAKDLETGTAAINCGADAVYIGAARFGAREAAGNDLAGIAALAEYAHRYWAKVYVTLNTLLYDEELPQAERLAREIYEAGADALIIQDTGLLELDLPPIPLFASTQMHNHTPERVAFLEKVGFQRVILARELSLEQIRAIRAQTSVELESFVHGALCVSYSGQCYMSYALGGRSGNRGQCAQPCRRAYRLLDREGSVLQEDRHLLSLRDLNLSPHLDELLDAGITSFKIEGRLKDKAYVMNVVGHYRQRLDALLEGRDLRAASSGRVHFDFSPNPARTFNRGFTRYFLHGRTEPVGSPDTPKATGEPLGRVVKMNRGSFVLDDEAEIQRGDGLCFFNRQRALVGTVVNDVQGRAIFPDKMWGLETGTLVYRNLDRAFLNALEKSKTARKISVRLRLAELHNGLVLFVQDEDGCEAMAALMMDKTPAEKPGQALAAIEKQLGKLGGTIFECADLRVDLEQPYFIPLSALNNLRRGALEELERERQKNYPRLYGGAVKNDAPYPAQQLGFEGNVLNFKAAEFYRRHGVSRIAPAAEAHPEFDPGGELYGRKVMTTRHCIKHQLGWCRRYGGSQPPAAQEPAALVDEQGNRYPLRFNCARCEMEVYFRAIEE